MPFFPENELEQALVRAAHDSSAAPDFYRLLLEHDLLVLGSVEGQEEATESFSLAPGGRVNLVTGARDGGQFLPVFSSLTRMQAYVKQDSKYLSVNGRALLDLTRGAPVVLNPGSEYGKDLTADEVGQLLDRPPPKSYVQVGQDEYPPGLVEALTAVFSTRPDIQAAWMIQVAFADQGGALHPLVGVETGGDWPSLMQAIQAAAEKSVPGMMFDVQRVDRRNPAGLTSALLQAPAFYQRPSTPLH